jgi:hypothetical protein
VILAGVAAVGVGAYFLLRMIKKNKAKKVQTLL